MTGGRDVRTGPFDGYLSSNVHGEHELSHTFVCSCLLSLFPSFHKRAKRILCHAVSGHLIIFLMVIFLSSCSFNLVSEPMLGWTSTCLHAHSCGISFLLLLFFFYHSSSLFPQAVTSWEHYLGQNKHI